MENEEDFSDLVAEHAAKESVRNGKRILLFISKILQRKRKAQEQRRSTGASGGSSSGKKYKDFKF